MLNIRGFTIYENYNEIRECRHKIKKLDTTLQVGDYWLTANGYYVPVVKTEQIKDSTKCWRLRITSPNIAPITIYKNKQTLEITYGALRNFNRTPDRAQKRNLMLQDRYFIELLESGVDIFEASQAAYHKAKQPLKLILQKVHNLMSTDAFKETIRSANFMSKLHESFETAGINQAWIAKQLKDIVEAPNESHQLRVFALDNIIKIAKENDTPKELIKTMNQAKTVADDERERIENLVLGTN